MEVYLIAALAGLLAVGLGVQHFKMIPALRQELRELADKAETDKEALRGQAAAAQSRADKAITAKETLEKSIADVKEHHDKEIERLNESYRENLNLVQTSANKALATEKARVNDTETERKALAAQLADTREALEKQKTSIEEREKAMAQRRQDIEDNQKALEDKFKTLGQEILETQSKKFTEEGARSIQEKLGPLKDLMGRVEKDLKEAETKRSSEKATLSQEIEKLVTNNATLSEQALALTNALKADKQKTGRWGEIVLERVLEMAGLRKGHEYEAQSSVTNTETGGTARPDIQVFLPGDKVIVIDSKVSLVAFDRFVNAETEAERLGALKDHSRAINEHISTLSRRRYETMVTGTLDYVLMFIPIEGALAAAMEATPDLPEKALQQNVAVTTPTTLLMAMKTVSYIWKSESRVENALEINKRVQKLHTAINDFLEEYRRLGSNLATMFNAYEAGMTRLDGQQGALFQANRISELSGIGGKLTRPENDKLEIAHGKARALIETPQPPVCD